MALKAFVANPLALFSVVVVLAAAFAAVVDDVVANVLRQPVEQARPHFFDGDATDRRPEHAVGLQGANNFGQRGDPVVVGKFAGAKQRVVDIGQPGALVAGFHFSFLLGSLNQAMGFIFPLFSEPVA